MENDSALRDVLWRMYQDHREQGRHHETQRSSVASALTAISGAVIGLITFDQAVTATDLPLALFLLMLGVFGALFSWKHYERFSLHAERARRHRDALDALLPGAPLKRLKKEAGDAHAKAFRWFRTARLHKFWLWLYVLLASLGAILSIVAIWFPWRAP